jgi:hypothetical protein
MHKRTIAATGLMIVGLLFAPPPAMAAGRSLGVVAMPYPGKLPMPGIIPLNPCTGVDQCVTAPDRSRHPLPPIRLPGASGSDPCKGVEQCLTGPARLD